MHNHPMTEEQLLNGFGTLYEPEPNSGCWLWLKSVISTGYGNARMNGGNVLIHRMLYSLIFGPIPDGLYVCHACDTPSCVNPKHMFLGAQKDNMQDAAIKGRLYGRETPKGQGHGMAKLTEADVLDIRRERENGDTLKTIGQAYGVTLGNVGLIVNRKTWKHI